MGERQCRRNPEATCSLTGCFSRWHSRGLCATHYGEYRRLGKEMPLPPAAPNRGGGNARPIGDRRVHEDGYASIKTGDGIVAEHRLVMEQMIGRKLLPGETVHHRNGRRADNRPENLELWYSQPAGQRVIDLVDYVVTHHRGLVLAALS